MSMKTILVPTGNHDAMRSTLETALLLARRCDSYINLDIPGKSQHVAPESVGQEQHRRRRGVARLQGGLECHEPAFRVGLRRKARAIVDQCHRQILWQRRRLHHARDAPDARIAKKRRAKPANFAPFMASCDSDTVATISCAGG